MPMLTRYMIEGDPGRYLTREGWFSSNRDEAQPFDDADEAYETAAQYPGATVETFACLSDVASFLPAHPMTEHYARRAWIVEQMNRRVG